MTRGKAWTRERILERLRAWADAHDGLAPRGYDWRPDRKIHPDWVRGEDPAYETVRLHFGTWAAAIEASGLSMRRATAGVRHHGDQRLSWAVWKARQEAQAVR